MPPIQPPCHVIQDTAGNRTVFVIQDANNEDVVMTHYEMTWNPQAIEDARQRAEIVCAALNAYLTS